MCNGLTNKHLNEERKTQRLQANKNTRTLTLSWEQPNLCDDRQRDSEHSANYKVVVIIGIKPMLKADEKCWCHFLGTELQGSEMSSQNFTLRDNSKPFICIGFNLMTSWNPALRKIAFFYKLYRIFCILFLLHRSATTLTQAPCLKRDFLNSLI